MTTAASVVQIHSHTLLCYYFGRSWSSNVHSGVRRANTGLVRFSQGFGIRFESLCGRVVQRPTISAIPHACAYTRRAPVRSPRSPVIMEYRPSGARTKTCERCGATSGERESKPRTRSSSKRTCCSARRKRFESWTLAVRRAHRSPSPAWPCWRTGWAPTRSGSRTVRRFRTSRGTGALRETRQCAPSSRQVWYPPVPVAISTTAIYWALAWRRVRCRSGRARSRSRPVRHCS